MEDSTAQNNLSTTEGTPEGNGAGETITGIMGSMAAEPKPEATPEAPKAEGTKAEGTTDKSQNEQAPAWTSQLPEDMRSNADIMKQLGKFNKIGDLAKSYSELEGKLGKSIEKPGKDASEEEIEKFYRQIGKPKSAKDYSIDDKEADYFKEIAFKNNLTDEQCKGLYAAAKEIGENALKVNKNALEEKARNTEEILKKEYGNDYKSKLELCKRGVKAYGGQSLGKKLADSGLLFEADVIKMFVTLGEMAAEAGTTTKGTAGQTGYKSTADGGMFKFKGL